MDASADYATIVELASKLVSLPSPSGSEGAVLEFIESLARESGFQVTRIAVDQALFIRHPEGQPRILLTTHLDTVPGGPEPLVRDGFLQGRGACDAKGIVAAMWFAFQKLVQSGARHTALLFVAGEETDSAGAKAAARAIGRELPRFDYFVNGEPTELRFVEAQRGTARVDLRCNGTSAHSGYPELGDSAVHRLLAVLADLLKEKWPEDPRLGASHLNVGVVSGGSGANVLAAEARAELMFRVTTRVEEVLVQARRVCDGRAELIVRSVSEPQLLHVPEGETGVVVGFGSDVGHLRPLGTPLMFGPGSIRDAHTDSERVRIADLEEAARKYVDICLKLERSL